MTPEVHIRPATAADGAALFDVHSAAVRELTGYSEDVKAKWLELLSPTAYAEGSPETVRLVAELSGKVVAFGEVDLRRSVLTALYVHPKVAHEGLGTSLLSELEQLARSSSARSLEVLSGLNAEGFYARHGYKVLGLASKRVTSRFSVEGVQMEKKL